MKLVLASTSAYRKMLLERLHLPFDTDRPETDETPLPGEAPAATAERLAAEEGRAVAARWPGGLAGCRGGSRWWSAPATWPWRSPHALPFRYCRTMWWRSANMCASI